jgi:hypothetical protein
VLEKFLKAWAERRKAQDMYSKLASISPSVDVQDRVGVSLSLLRRVMAVAKMKKILNIEAALEMIALGMVICSEVRIFINID